MNSEEDILSFMDLLDLDEEMVDTRLKSIMVRDTFTNKHLKNAIQLLKYKQLINCQENTECDNDNECSFLVKLINQVNYENVVNVCKITTLTLSLNCTTLVNKSEHLVQQILSDIYVSSEGKSNDKSTLLTLQLCDTILEAVIKIGEKLTLPFLEIPVSRILDFPDEKLRVHFLTSSVPKLFEGVQGYSILDVIWNYVIVSDGQDALKILSCLSEYYIPVPDREGKVLYQSEVVYQAAFWNIILNGLCSNNPMKRKFAVYLGKRAIDCLAAGKRDIKLSVENKIFSWNCKKAALLKSDWYNFFILIDSLEEKQSNIVLPSLHLFEKLNNLEKCWLNCPFYLGLSHDNTQVRLKSIFYKLDTSLKSLNEAVLLLSAVNDNNIFDDVIGYDILKTKMRSFFSQEEELAYVLKSLALVKWSPVPLYHVSEVLSELKLKGFQLDNAVQIINEILKIPCNNIVIRKAVHTNLFCFIEKCFNLHWRDLLNILPHFQINLLNNKLILMVKENMNSEKERIEFLKLISEKIHNENVDLALLYLENKPEDMSIFIDIINEKVKIVQDIVNRQYSNKKECFNDAVFIALLCLKTKNMDTSIKETLYGILSQNKKLILHYFMALTTSEVTVDIEEIVVVSEIIKSFDCKDLGDVILQFYKISKVLFIDSRSDLDKTVLGLFYISSLNENTVLTTLYNNEMVHMEQLLEIKSLDNKQNSRLLNAFYEKLCEFIFHVMKEDNKYDSIKILEFVDKVTECGGYGCLYWILKIMNELLPILLSYKDSRFDVAQFVHRMWREIEELKSNHQYSPCIEEFINLITQECVIDDPMYNNIVTLYCTEVIENAAARNAPLYYLVRKLNCIEINENRGHLVYILCEILMYSPVPRKDQRITDNLMIEILHDPKYQVTSKDTATHFNFQIQYSAISVLSKIKHEDIYRTITSFFLNKIDILMMNKQRYHGNSQCHRSLLLCLQHLLFLFSLTNLECGIENWCEDLLGKLPHQQSVRVCLEWLIALFYYKKGVEINQEFIDHLDAKKIPLTSQFIIIYNIMKRKCNNCSEREYNFVLHHLLGNTMGPMYNVRLYAQCISKQLYKLRESSEHKYMIKIVEQNCAKDKNCARLEEDFFLSRFDILSELKPSFIYHFVPNYTEANNDKIYMELINEELKIMNRNNEGQLNDEEIFKFKYPKGKAKSVESFDGTGSIQKKYVPWGSMSDIEVYGISKKKENPSELIVIASLIDKLPNLGGMARTSEVFGVRTYVIDSLRHLQDSQFQALSVSAERWVNIEEVRPGPPLKAYIQSKKLEGYSIVAAEQTSTSCQLDKFKFDRKTVLLLGHEKEGVPCDLLPLMERCVEVPQRGVVRSLNVHVTAAIFVWEYTRQLLL